MSLKQLAAQIRAADAARTALNPAPTAPRATSTPELQVWVVIRAIDGGDAVDVGVTVHATRELAEASVLADALAFWDELSYATRARVATWSGAAGPASFDDAIAVLGVGGERISIKTRVLDQGARS